MKAFLRISIAIFAVIILTFVLFCSIHKLPTKQLKIEDIKSISVLNFNKDRRMKYEQNLKNKFGKYFLGHKIKDLRLKNTCNGKKELVAENIVNGKIVTYNDVKDKEGYSVFKDGIWKICSKYKKNECIYYMQNTNILLKRMVYSDNKKFNAFGCSFSHMRAIEKIAKQPDDTYGLIFEDDFDVSDNFDNDIKEAFKAVPKDFDILKLTLDGISIEKRRRKLLFIKALKEEIKSYIKNGYDEWIDLSVQNEMNRKLSVGAQAYLVSSQGARKILSFVRNNITLCVADIDMFYYIPKFNNDIKAYFYTGKVPFFLLDSCKVSTIDI